MKGTGYTFFSADFTASRSALVIACVAATLWVQQWPELPAAIWCLGALAPILLWFLYPRYRLLYAFALAIAWALLHGHWRLYSALPEPLARQDIAVSGYIASIPERQERGLRFDFAVDVYPGMEAAAARRLPRKLRLSWYGSGAGPAASPVPGEYWELTVRLKPAHGFMNPGAFDYEGWLFGQGIRATGYVRENPGNRRLREGSRAYALQWARHALLSRIHASAPPGEFTGLMTALAIGYQSDISKEQWRLLADTGTTHLISISGLHVSMIAFLCYLIVFRLHVLLMPLLTRYPLWPAQRSGAIAGLAGALAYAALAGFALPTVRSLLMLAVLFYALFFYRQLRPWQALSTALLAVVVLDPFAVNSPSFWLSFGAVMILVYLLSGRFRAGDTAGSASPAWRRRLGRWAFVQLAFVPALIPLTLFWFGRGALTAATANFIAIPWVSWGVVPVILLASCMAFISEAAAGVMFTTGALMLQCLWQVLEWLARLPYGQWAQHPPGPAGLALAVLGLAWLLAPRGVPGRWAGIACLLPLFWLRPQGPPAEGDVWFTVLDVGQGTSAVVRTKSHVLLYDAGPRFSESFDAGAAVVVPYLRAQGVSLLDRVVLSHSDNDHQGGLESVLREIPAAMVLAGEPGRYPAGLPPPRQCRAGQRWRWDGVDFEMLWPEAPGGGNNASCVLRVAAPGGSILLPGDIEKEAEQRLWSGGGLQAADILLMPHHGSRSSSTPLLVEAVRPRYAIATADYRNRYGFPKADVTERYRNAGATVLVTGHTGALHFTIDHASGIAEPVLYRHAGRRYWRHLPLPEDWRFSP